MAEDTRKEPIVYYKGKEYYLISNENGVSKLEDTTTPNIKMVVEGKNVLTKEEFEYQKSKRVSQHVNWIK